MVNTLITILIGSILFSSCSTRLYDYFKEDPETQQRNEKLMKSFEIDEKVLEKFQQKEEPVVVNEEKPQAIVTNKKTNIPKQIKVELKPTKKEATKKILKVKDIYPDDYPPEYRKVDKSSSLYWDEFKPLIFPGEEVYMDINYMGVSTGKIAITTKGQSKIGEQEVFHLNARVKTSKYYSYLYELDDNLDSFVTTEKFIPIKYSLIQRESGQNIDDLQLFDLKEFKSYSFFQRETKKKTQKNKGVKFIPKYFQDPLSVIFFLRGLPMVKGNKYDIPLINKGKLIHLKAEIGDIEEIKTSLGNREAVKVFASTTYSGDTLKSGDMEFWFSNDDRRIFLKFKAKISIGAISGDIEKYTH